MLVFVCDVLVLFRLLPPPDVNVGWTDLEWTATCRGGGRGGGGGMEMDAGEGNATLVTLG